MKPEYKEIEVELLSGKVVSSIEYEADVELMIIRFEDGSELRISALGHYSHLSYSAYEVEENV